MAKTNGVKKASAPAKKTGSPKKSQSTKKPNSIKKASAKKAASSQKSSPQKRASPVKSKATPKKGGKQSGFSRPEKTDFTPLYKAHRKQMDANGCDIDNMIKLRRTIHQNAEGGFQEHETVKLLGDTLASFGIDRKCMKKCAKTGLVVDIMGTGPADKSSSGPKLVALRTDLDALPMPENNKSLPYCTKTKFAHMCGHDGHMACLMSAAAVIAKNRSKIPSNKGVRLLLQPAEEGPGGALPMVKEGCMKNVDEVYGFHNIPNFDEGDIRVCEGGFFAAVTTVYIKIIGQGGHGSTPHKLQDAVSAANAVFQSLHTIQSRNIHSEKQFVFTLPYMTAGTAHNVFPDFAVMEGTIRSFDEETRLRVCERIRKISTDIASAMECKAEVVLTSLYPAVVNPAVQTQHVERLAKKWFGPAHFSVDDLPLCASEDFSYFLHEKPGCFFALGTMKPGSKPRTLHTSDYDFNDDMVATGGYFWIRLIEDRLNVKLFK